MKIDGTKLIPETVEYVLANGNYSTVILIDGRKLMSSHNLGRVETFLRLTRINRGIAVNARYIKEITDGTIIMNSGFVAEPSRRRIPDLLSLTGGYKLYVTKDSNH